MLEAMHMMEYCRDRGRRFDTDFDLGAILGELDWYKEFYRLKEKALGTRSKSAAGGR